MDNWKESLKNRMLERKRQLEEVMDSVILLVEEGKLEGPETEAERVWLDGVAVGLGLNLCPGHFKIGDAIGINMDRALGADIIMPARNLSAYKSNQFDYIVTNYFEAFPCPLESLFNIGRILKPGGVLAIVFLNTDAAVNSDLDNPVMNSQKRQSVFTASTMRRYLIKAEYENIEITPGASDYYLRAKAYKRK